MASQWKLAVNLPGALFIAAGAVLLAFAAGIAYQKHSVLHSWPVVKAEVTRSRVVSDQQGNYNVDIEFRYVVNGVEQRKAVSAGFKSSVYSMMKSRVDAHPVGSFHIIRYNPTDPEDIRFDAAYSFSFFLAPMLLAGMSVIFGGIGLWATVTPRRGRPLKSAGIGRQQLRELMAKARAEREARERKPDRTPMFVGGFFLLFGVGFVLLAGWLALAKRAVITAWPALEAQVVRSHVTTVSDTQRAGPSYGLEIEFRYTIGPKDYTTTTSSGESTSSYGSMEELAHAYSPGSRHTIHYDPDDPNIIRYGVGYTLDFFFWPVIMAVSGLGVAVLGGTLMIAFRSGSRPGI